MVLDAFVAASRNGDFQGLLAVLDPNVVLRSDGGRARPGLVEIARGAEAVASRAMLYRHVRSTPVLVNGVVGGVAWTPTGEPLAVLSCTVRNGEDRIHRGAYRPGAAPQPQRQPLQSVKGQATEADR